MPGSRRLAPGIYRASEIPDVLDRRAHVATHRFPAVLYGRKSLNAAQ
jgi:hypothetical protein